MTPSSQAAVGSQSLVHSKQGISIVSNRDPAAGGLAPGNPAPSRRTVAGAKPPGLGQRVCVGRNAICWPIVCAAIGLFPFTPLLTGDTRVIPSEDACDYEFFQLPVREFAREEMLAGRLPAWIPYLGCGLPLHATGQASLANPLLTPLVLLLGANAGIKASLWLHLLLAFAGEYRLARSLFLSRAAAAFAGLVTSQSAFVVAHLMEGHVTMVMAYAWLPWLLAAVIRLMRSPGPRSAAFASAAVALLVLASHPQIAYYGILFCSAWALGSLACGCAARHRAKALGWSAAAAAVALLLSGVQVVPTLELTRDGIGGSDRGTLAYAGSYSCNPLDLLRFIVPNALGNSLRQIPTFADSGYIHEKIGYLGIGTLMLGQFALTRRSVRRWERGAALLCAGAVILSLGNALLGIQVMAAVPGFYLFRCPARVFCMLSVLAPLIAGRGFDAILRGRPAEDDESSSRWRLWRRRGQALLLVLILGAVIVQFHIQGWTTYAGFFTAVAFPEWVFAFVVAGVTALAFFAARTIALRSQTRAAALLLAVTAVDLATGSAAMFRLLDEAQGTAPASVVERAAGFRFIDIREPPHPTEDDIRYSKLVPVAVRQRFPMIGTNEGGVVPGGFERLQKAAGKNGNRIPAAAACRFACFRKSEWTELAGALPRIRFLPGESAALADVPIEEFDPASWPASRFEHQVTEHATRIEIESDAPADGLVVVADLWYPGWTCTVDGAVTPISRVHGVFRGVPVPAGRHRIEMIYRPAIIAWGGLCTIAGVVGWVMLLVSGRLVRRQAASGAFVT